MTVDADDRLYGFFYILDGFLFWWDQHEITDAGNDHFDRWRQHNCRKTDGNDLIQVRDDRLEPVCFDDDRQEKGDGHSDGDNSVNAPALHIHFQKRGFDRPVFYIEIQRYCHTESAGNQLKIRDRVECHYMSAVNQKMNVVDDQIPLR